FRTMAEATIYQMTTNSGSDGFMKLRNELWLFQIHLTLDIDTSLTNEDFASIRERFDAARRAVASRPTLRSTHRVVLTNKVCKLSEAAESARSHGLMVVWRDQLESFWPPRVYFAARDHVNDDETALKCFFPS